MIDQLSFVTRTDDGVVAWKDMPEGDYGALCLIGADAAMETVTMLRKRHSPFLLTNVLQLIARRPVDGLTIGFYQALGEILDD